MAMSGKGTGMVGYNVMRRSTQEHHLIVAHEVNGRTQRNDNDHQQAPPTHPRRDGRRTGWTFLGET
ncbi:hypothetical protein CU103_30655 [Phyllobacterium sophorae]|uniref:Uncharacterized protein n=1 Tax=Phyllobacterium sophorae TaxID=1520277 RepID=A0A2P7AMZ9_9HYPH|nr:hypothetical protein CU103_30655 [Phyllobacterium sophorae]